MTLGRVLPPPSADVAVPWRRLNPRMLLVHPVIELGRALPALAGLLLAGAGSGHGARWSLLGAGVVIVAATLRWFTTRFQITSQQIELRHGLLRRRTITAPLDRVRTVDVSAHPLHRALGLARVAIGTGISDRKHRAALVLDGLGTAEAARLRAELLHRTPTRFVAPSDETELARLDPRWIRYAPFTLSGAVSALAIATLAWRVQSETHTDLERFGPLRAVIAHLRAVPWWRDVIEIGLALLAFIALASTCGYVLAFWRFRLSRHRGGTLHMTRGLITSRATSIEARRLHGAELSEPLLLRAAGGARVIAIATGLRVGHGAERGGTLLLPPAPRAEAERVAAAVCDAGEAFVMPLAAHGPRAVRRRYVRAVAGGLLVGAALGALAAWLSSPIWGVVTGGITLLASLLLAADRAASLGHAVAAGFIVTRYGSLVRRRSAVACGGVIGWNLRRSFFQRRAGLATLTATTAAGRQAYHLPDVTLPEALRIAETVTPGLLDQFRG